VASRLLVAGGGSGGGGAAAAGAAAALPPAAPCFDPVAAAAAAAEEDDGMGDWDDDDDDDFGGTQPFSQPSASQSAATTTTTAAAAAAAAAAVAPRARKLVLALTNRMLTGGLGQPLRHKQRLQLDVVQKDLGPGVDFVPSTRVAVRRVTWKQLAADLCGGAKALLAELIAHAARHPAGAYVLVERGAKEGAPPTAARAATALARLAGVRGLRVLHSSGSAQTAALIGALVRCVLLLRAACCCVLLLLLLLMMLLLLPSPSPSPPTPPLLPRCLRVACTRACSDIAHPGRPRPRDLARSQEGGRCRLWASRAGRWQRTPTGISDQRARCDVRRRQRASAPLPWQAVRVARACHAGAARDALQCGLTEHGAAHRSLLPEDAQGLRRRRGLT
jgi:hypothetical protein